MGKRRQLTWAQTAGMCALALLLTACGEQDLDSNLENYVTRLGNTLDIQPQDIAASSRARPPRTGQLQQELRSDSVDALDFMALSGCALQITIGKRNSSLGRLARPSQKLLLELEYLRLAPECVAQLRKDSRAALADTLEHSWELKRKQLPQRIFNATLGGEEYRAFWLASPEPGGYPPVSSSVVIAALGSINHNIRRWLEGDYRADNREFELWLGEIAGGDGGALLQSLSRQQDWLNEANRMLEMRMGKGALCSPNRRDDAADVLPNIMKKHFIGEIQPEAAQMERRVYDLLPPITSLEAELAAALPETYRTWRSERDSLLASARLAPRRHVTRLTEILEPCGA